MERREALKLSAALMGTGLSGIVFSGMLNGCKVDTRAHWTPLFLTGAQAGTLAELADHILPPTDSPGAKDVFVDRFIDQLLANCYDEDGQRQFLKGLNSLMDECDRKFGKSFEECAPEERDAFLRELESVPFEPARYLWGNQIIAEKNPSFYRQLKGLILFGYFSSEEIGKNVLNYDPVPGVFIGCMPLSEIGTVWAL